MKKIGVILFGCCLGVLLSASVATAGPKGECNRILAKQVGQAEKIHNGVDTAASCVDLLGGLLEFLLNPNQCLVLLNNGDGTFADQVTHQVGFGPSAVAAADFNGDGFITGFDFLAWQRGLGTIAPNATKADGDADNDLDVDSSDLDVWESQYGTAAPVVAPAFRLSPQLVDLAMMMDKPETTLDSNRTEVDLAELYSAVAPDSVNRDPAPLPRRDTAQPATVSAEEERATEEDVAILSELVFSDL
ncbi:MAG: VCBS repeat-containing protein [Planctomycetes bacterium]|nr:VCBS repeat-containing protein [Planctomycetota bacterium]